MNVLYGFEVEFRTRKGRWERAWQQGRRDGPGEDGWVLIVRRGGRQRFYPPDRVRKVQP